MTVHSDGSFDINLPDKPFEMLNGLRCIYGALLDYAKGLGDRNRMTFILSEHFAHQDFEQKLLNRTIKDALLPGQPILH